MVRLGAFKGRLKDDPTQTNTQTMVWVGVSPLRRALTTTQPELATKLWQHAHFVIDFWSGTGPMYYVVSNMYYVISNMYYVVSSVYYVTSSMHYVVSGIYCVLSNM